MIAVADSRCRHFGSSFWVILLRRSRTSFRGVVPFCRSVVLVRRSVELFCCVVVTCLASFRCVAELCHPVLSFHRVIPLRRSTAFLFQRLGRLDCIGSVALGNVGMRWEVGTSSIARQGGYYALEFVDCNLCWRFSTRTKWRFSANARCRFSVHTEYTLSARKRSSSMNLSLYR